MSSTAELVVPQSRRRWPIAPPTLTPPALGPSARTAGDLSTQHVLASSPVIGCANMTVVFSLLNRPARLAGDW